jgi:hypothetical protein
MLISGTPQNLGGGSASWPIGAQAEVPADRAMPHGRPHRTPQDRSPGLACVQTMGISNGLCLHLMVSAESGMWMMRG